MTLKPITLFAALSVALVLMVVVLANWLPSDSNRFRLQTMAAEALGMETRIEGPLEINYLPRLHLALNDVSIGGEGADLVSTDRVNLGIALLPLLTGRLQIQSIELSKPSITIVRDGAVNFDFEISQTTRNILDTLGGTEFSLADAALIYTNTATDTTLSASACDLQMEGLRLSDPASITAETTLLQRLSFTAEIYCDDFQLSNYSGTELAVTTVATDGVFTMMPITMQFLGGQGASIVEADFSATTPKYRVTYVLPKLDLEGLLNTLPSEFSAAGPLDLTLNLTMQGSGVDELTRSADGTIFLHGAGLTLIGVDLDEELERFESSQNFDLVDAGALFFAGPLGLLATKGYDFTSLLARSGGDSEISSLISDWIIEDGIAMSTDVALATRHNRIAVQGELDLVNRQFVDVTMALVDREGCSVVQQDISGSFSEPEAFRSNLVTTLAGPVLRILEQGVALLTDEPCDVFYTGAVLAP